MNAASPIQSRVPEDDYRAIPAINISLLKELRRSPLHYKYRTKHQLESPVLTLGSASHCATLEPERFGNAYAIWSNRTASGRMSPRTGKTWDEFCAKHADKTILTEDEANTALTIAHAVRNDPVAAKYLLAGEPEVTINWGLKDGRRAKGRVDWLTRQPDADVIVGLKTAKDCRPFVFGAAAAKLGYHLQWAWYHDGYIAAVGRVPRMVEIVVESAPPHAVVVYTIPDDVLAQGQDEYTDLLRILNDCEERGYFPGPAETEQMLTLPSWVYGPADDDLSDLGLEA